MVHDLNKTDIKQYLFPLFVMLKGVPSGMQKLMYRGLMKDDKTLRDLKVTKGVKLMLIGSTINDVLEVNKPVAKGTTKEKDEAGTL